MSKFSLQETSQGRRVCHSFGYHITELNCYTESPSAKMQEIQSLPQAGVLEPCTNLFIAVYQLFLHVTASGFSAYYLGFFIAFSQHRHSTPPPPFLQSIDINTSIMALGTAHLEL